MYWPNLQLTKQEALTHAVYAEPGKSQRAVKYRVYTGEVNITPTITEDIENIQISLRTRIMALTASGDIHNVEVEIYDSTGERYTMGFTPLTNLFPGTARDPRGELLNQFLNRYATAFSVPPNTYSVYGNTLGLAGNGGMVMAPHVLEPNIVLASNQQLSIKARALVPPRTLNPAHVGDTPRQERFTVEFCLHTWAFTNE